MTLSLKTSSPTYRPLDSMAMLLMLLLCACWGSQQVTMKSIAAELNPTLQVGLRSLVAACCVFLFMLARREALNWRDGTLSSGLTAGLLFAFEFLLVSIGVKLTTASHMSVFLYTSPLFTAIGLHFLVPQERMHGRQWRGIFLAFLGVVVIFADGFFGPTHTQMGTQALIGDALGILAGVFWALTTLVIKSSKLKNASAAKTLLYQLTMTALVLLTYAACTGIISESAPPQSWSSAVWVSLTYQTLIIAFVSLLAWFWLLTQYLASRLSVFSFLTPVFGMIFGVVYLQEPLTLYFVAGALMIFLGILMVNQKQNVGKYHPPSPQK